MPTLTTASNPGWGRTVQTRETAKTLWVPAVNNHGGFGRWAYLEVLDTWDAKNLIRTFLRTQELVHV
jgi:hypothetical protein